MKVTQSPFERGAIVLAAYRLSAWYYSEQKVNSSRCLILFHLNKG
jgi:hypothetical protein